MPLPNSAPYARPAFGDVLPMTAASDVNTSGAPFAKARKVTPFNRNKYDIVKQAYRNILTDL